MIEKMIEMIEKNADKMAEDLKERLITDGTTPSFKVLDERDLYNDIHGIYSHLGYWLLKDPQRGPVQIYYTEMGKKRRMEGFPLPELIQALIVTKKHIWDTVAEKGIMGSAVSLNSAIDLITFLNRFFDFAIYYTVYGYYKSLGVLEF